MNQEASEIIDERIQYICYIIRSIEMDVQLYLLDFVAATCDTDKELIFTDTDKIHIAHARWLYWYAYRYMTNESYEKIAITTNRLGHHFTPRSITGGVNKMSMMIEQEPIWKKRWTLVKKIIKSQVSTIDASTKEPPKAVVKVPSSLKDIIKIEYTNE